MRILSQKFENLIIALHCDQTSFKLKGECIFRFIEYIKVYLTFVLIVRYLAFLPFDCIISVLLHFLSSSRELSQSCSASLAPL